MAKITQGIHHVSGIPLGGIGTGTVEIRPDGLFHEWQIFNKGQWAPGSPCCGAGGTPVEPDALVFMVRTKTLDGRITVRYLAVDERLQELYSFSWAKCVQQIDFDGRFPTALLSYKDDSLPVELTAEIFSPFIPNDSRASGTPGFYVRFIARNPSNSALEVSILGRLMNLAGHGQVARQPRNYVKTETNCTMVRLTAEGLDENECTTGEMAFSVVADDVSYIAGTFKNEGSIRMWESIYGMKVHSHLYHFRDEGQLPNLSASAPPEASAISAKELSISRRRALLSEWLQHSWVYDKYRKLFTTEVTQENEEELLTQFLDDTAREFAALGNREWGESALCARLNLGPAGTESVLFTTSWFFPNHVSPSGRKLGHAYENRFTDVTEVNRFLLNEFENLRRCTFLVPELLYGSSLPEECADAISSQLSILTKCTWWTKDGCFGVWEGLGCCGFHTMDITYQGSFPIIALFPDLQKTQMTHGAKFQRKDGRVHHLFTPDFFSVDDGFDRVDMNPQFVMLAARDYLWSGDKEYLERLWPHIVRAMENSELLDSDGDGLPDQDTKRNTYDVWDFSGCPSYISSLWLGALKSAIRLAEEMGDEEKRAHWSDIYARGTRALEEKLWNGRYYVLWKDERTNQVDECCMSDQMSAEWFCGIMGWGHICKPPRIRTALKSILKYNFKPDTGLINASYPPGVTPRQPTFGNLQAEATWTGIEYTVAALLIEQGMVGDGLAVVRDIHKRYYQAGRFWNHVECGDHYYRALSSWTLLLALSGFQLDVPRGWMKFAPRIMAEECEYPFFAPGVVGTYQETGSLLEKCFVVEILEGEIEIRVLEIPAGQTVTVNDIPVKAKCRVTKEATRFHFKESLLLESGDVLVVY